MRLMQRAAALATILAAAVALATGPGSAQNMGRPLCKSATIRLATSEPVYYGTGQYGWLLRVRNRGDRPCRLRRRPRLALVDRRGALPYAVAYHRRCVWGCAIIRVRGVQSRWMLLREHRSVFVAFHQYRCDFGHQRNASAVRLGLDVTLHLRLPPWPAMGWCPAAGGEPAAVLNLSPFEPTPRDAMARG